MSTQGAASTLPLADALCARIHCRNIGTWLSELAATLGVPADALMPRPPVRRHELIVPGRGLRLVLSHPHAGEVDEGDPDRWVITEAQFSVTGQPDNHWAYPLPFGLCAESETPQTAATKLDGEADGLGARALASGDYRQSFFLDHALVLEIRWNVTLQGFSQVTLIRLGSELLEPTV